MDPLRLRFLSPFGSKNKLDKSGFPFLLHQKCTEKSAKKIELCFQRFQLHLWQARQQVQSDPSFPAQFAPEKLWERKTIPYWFHHHFIGVNRDAPYLKLTASLHLKMDGRLEYFQPFPSGIRSIFFRGESLSCEKLRVHHVYETTTKRFP